MPISPSQFNVQFRILKLNWIFLQPLWIEHDEHKSIASFHMLGKVTFLRPFPRYNINCTDIIHRWRSMEPLFLVTELTSNIFISNKGSFYEFGLVCRYAATFCCPIYFLFATGTMNSVIQNFKVVNDYLEWNRAKLLVDCR